MAEFAERFKNNVKTNFDQSDKLYEAFEAKHLFFQNLTDLLLNQVFSFSDDSSRWQTESFSILDVGCGTGISTRRLSQLFPKAKIIGLDLSAGMLEAARQMSPEIEFVCGDGEQLLKYFPEDSFDLIMYNASIFLMPSQEKTLEQSAKLLKPNGVVAVSALMRLAEINGTALNALPSFKGIINNEQLPMLFEKLFSKSSVKSEKIPLTIEVVKDMYTIPALSAAPFPNRPYEERIKCLDQLIEELKDRQLQLAQDWLLVVGQ